MDIEHLLIRGIVEWKIKGDRVAQTASIRATACVSGLALISIVNDFLSLFYLSTYLYTRPKITM